MTEAVHTLVYITDKHHLTVHAWERMSGRSISAQAIRRVLEHGRVKYDRGAKIYVVGRKEVGNKSEQGVDLKDVEGLHVVCTAEDVIKTVYRTQDLGRLKKRSRRQPPVHLRSSRLSRLLRKIDEANKPAEPAAAEAQEAQAS